MTYTVARKFSEIYLSAYICCTGGHVDLGRTQAVAWREVLEFSNASKSEPGVGASIDR